MLDAVVRIQKWQRLAGLDILGGRGESRAEGIIVVATLNPVTSITLDVEEGAVEREEFLRRMFGAL